MQKTKLDVLIALFCYGGNGGVATILPEIATWLVRTDRFLSRDERVGRVGVKRFGDVPLTMERNRVVRDAMDREFDVIIMLDSDNVPDLYLGHLPEAKGFIETSFDFLYERMERKLPSVVCAPYCGPPPHPVGGGEENVYVFHGTTNESSDQDMKSVGSIRFEAYSREHSSLMRGIQPIAAGPTGCIMYSTDAFALMPISSLSDEEILHQHASGKLTTENARRMLRMQSWFFYEFTDQYQTQKASTEDVTNTREIQLAGIQKHGEPIVFCNWDAWAGHFKPKCVGKPHPLRIEQISDVFAQAVTNNISVTETSVMLNYEDEDFDDQDADPPEVDDTDFDEDEIAIEKGLSDKVKRKLVPKKSVAAAACREVEWTLKAMNAKRVIVIGDRSGELVSAAKGAGCEAVYTVGLSDAVSIDGIRRVVGLGTDPIDVALRIKSGGLNAVVLKPREGLDVHEAVREWIGHLDQGGQMFLVQEAGLVMEDDFVLDATVEGWEALLGERGDLCMIRQLKAQASDTFEL